MTVNRVELFGIPFSNVTFDDLCSHVAARIRERKPGFIITPNVDHVCAFHRDPYFQKAYKQAFLLVADGMPIIWASRLLGRPLVRKLSGSDLVLQLSKFAAQHDHTVFLFGALEGVAETAAEKLQREYPGLRIVGTYSPPVAFERDPKEDDKAVGRLRESGADICFVALGSPRQEIWMHRNHRNAGIPVMIGIGAGLDFASGRIKRAPLWMQYAGLEWFWRLCHEPRRLWHRYLVDDLLFFRLLGREVLQRFGFRPTDPFL